MGKIENLVEILESQCSLYSELIEIMALEKEAVTRWNVDDTIELTKRKDTVLYKEKVLEEARKTSIKKLSLELGIEDITLSDIIETCQDEEQRSRLQSVRERLSNLVSKLNDENLALKIIYRTNIGLVSEFFDRLGITSTKTYGGTSKPAKGTTSIIDRRG
ncbi:flagellar export chaperone FlgN [Limisalsivibrio acetivorans]|uniref:flagellar export chaperone FlgN n=1 Tax=Limisalsivibrio acetivorans TaxID=1304888 RepID=UPI0003B3D29B|nr:flagellar export chaperone FlgN [Limisalsivibrio acetivorans]